MQMRIGRIAGGVGATLLACGMAFGQQSSGPDVIAAEITGPSYWGTVGDISGYSIGTTSCNVGDEDLLWDDELGDGTPANLHPVMSQNIFRLKDGRFEQVGQGWLKHAFFALNFDGLCGFTCQEAPNGSFLGPGCWDPYSSGLNGSQGGLGPRFEINPATGVYPWPFTADGFSGNAIYKRVQVAVDDIRPSMNPGALYFGEGQYVTPDDAQAGNGNNNASYRALSVGSFQGGGYNLSFVGPTFSGEAAIKAWQDADPSVTEVPVDFRGDGRFWVAYKVTDNGNGTWSYEYAVQNLNNDAAAGQFRIPIGSGVTITNIGFHDVDYHSGEPFDNTDWTGAVVGGAVEWNSPQTFAQNPDSNALRWGTLYNFRFDANTGPENVMGSMTSFKPLPIPTESFDALGPGDFSSCPADLNSATAGNPAAPNWGVPDGQLTPTDFSAFSFFYGTGDLRADLNTSSAPSPAFPGWGVPDGLLTPTDFSAFSFFFGAGCD